MKYSLYDIIRLAKRNGYTIDNRPYKLNLIGVRNVNATNQQKFDDVIAYFYYDDKGNIVGKVASATTDPSTFWLENPMNTKGAAILKSGEYKDSWGIGLHKGQYAALVQTKPVTVIRDDDRNAFINFLAPTTTGLYGINIHRASVKNNIQYIGADSAGCQTFQNKSDFDDMMKLARKSRDLYGNNFTYTLIDQKQVYTNYAVVGGLVVGLILYIKYLKDKKIWK